MLQPTQEQSSYGLSKVKFSWLVALQSQAAVASNSLKQPLQLTVSASHSVISYAARLAYSSLQLTTVRCYLSKRKHALTRTYSLSLLALAHVQMLCLRGHHRVVKLI